MKQKAMHIVTNPSGGWSVRKAGSTRALRNFKTQEEAVRYVQKLASKETGYLYIHRKNGTIRERQQTKKEKV